MTQRLAEPADIAEIRQRTITGLPIDVHMCMLSGGVLRFVFKRERQSVPPRLDQFLRLATATDAQVARFAVKWGALVLCEHGVPLDLCCAPLPKGTTWTERPQDWRAWAGRFKALLALGRDLDSGRPWSSEGVARALDWHSLPARADEIHLLPAGLEALVGPRAPDGLRRAHLAGALNRLMLGGRVARQVLPLRTGWAMVDGSRWLFGALAQRLALEVVEVRSAAVCAECGRGFKAERRTARYCERCRKAGVPLRRAQRAARERRRAAGLTSRGTARVRVL